MALSAGLGLNDLDPVFVLKAPGLPIGARRHRAVDGDGDSRPRRIQSIRCDDLGDRLAPMFPRLAVEGGRAAFEAGRMPKRLYASASSPEDGVIEA